jgi:hypothetical protein
MNKATPEQLVTGVKLDAGKSRLDLIPPHAIKALGDTFAYGAKKYADRNWEKGMDWGRVYAATQRHLNEFWSGNDIDPESGLQHLAQAMFGCAVLLEYGRAGVGRDDRSAIGRPVPDVPAIAPKRRRN